MTDPAQMSMEPSGALRRSRLRARQLLALVRLRQFDVSTETGRSQERYRRVALTALAAAFAKAVSFLTILVTVPITLHYLGSERYGLWMTISSLTVILIFADLGLGNGLMNAVSAAYGRNDREGARLSVSSGFFMLLAVAGLVLAVFAALYVVIPWQSVFRISSPLAVEEAGPAVAVFVVCFALSLPLGVVQRVQMGHQEGFASQLWQALGSVLGLVAVLVAVYNKLSLPFLVLAMSGGPLLATFANAVHQFGWRRPWLRPTWRYARLTESRRLLRVGIWFFVLQLALALTLTSDNLVVAQVLGAEVVPQYAVPMRLFSILVVALAMALTPLWPAYTEAVARGDTKWVQRTYARSLRLSTLGIGIPALVLVLAGPWILDRWVGPSIQPTFWLLLGLGVWTTLSAIGASISMFLNGIGAIPFQAVVGLAAGIVALGLKILFTGWFGVAGTVWAIVIAYALINLIPVIWYASRQLATPELRAESPGVWSR
jgi:O-antigen/teichoic acid export membrane protein